MLNDLSEARLKELEILYRAKEELHEPLINILLWASVYLEESATKLEGVDATYAKRLRSKADILNKAQLDMGQYLSKA